MQPVLLFQLLVLVVTANAIPVFAKTLFGPRTAWPLDGGMTLSDGQPVLGTSKTIHGVVLSILVTPVVALLREIEVHLAGGSDVGTACRTAGISDATYYACGKKFGGMGRQLAELKTLQREDQRLKKIVADLELDKLTLKESLDFLETRG